MRKTRQMQNIETRSVLGSVLALAVAVGLLLGLVNNGRVNAAGGQGLPGSGPYRLVENWPQMPPDDPRFGTMSGVAVDDDGVIYGLNRDRGTVWMWDKSGRYLGDWGPGVTVFSHDMEYDRHEGVIWVADRDAHLVKKYSLDGDLLMTIGHYEEPGDSVGHFNGPSDMVVAENGDIFVSDGYWNQRIMKFNKDGRYLAQMGTPGRAKWQFGLLHHIKITDGGLLIISDLCGYAAPGTPGRFPCPGSRTVVVDTDLQWVGERPSMGATFVRGDTLYSWGGDGLVITNSRTGETLETIPIENPTSAHQIAIAADGDIYTADEALVAFGSSGQRLGGLGAIRRYTRNP